MVIIKKRVAQVFQKKVPIRTRGWVQYKERKPVTEQD